MLCSLFGTNKDKRTAIFIGRMSATCHGATCTYLAYLFIWNRPEVEKINTSNKLFSPPKRYRYSGKTFFRHFESDLVVVLFLIFLRILNYFMPLFYHYKNYKKKYLDRTFIILNVKQTKKMVNKVCLFLI